MARRRPGRHRPPFEEESWSLESEEFHPADQRHEHSLTERVYRRLRQPA